MTLRQVTSICALLLTGFMASAARCEETPIARCIAAEAQKLDFQGVVMVTLPTGSSVYASGRLGGPESGEVGADTRFNLASAGKMFTAVAVAQLVDGGTIGLDDEIGRYVAGLMPQTAKVTVRQLLTHSAGLGNYFTPANLGELEKARSASDLLPLITKEVPAFSPGTRFQYSNSGFLLLGVIIERVSGQSYDGYLQGHIFRPAGMSASGMDPGGTATRAIGMTSVPPLPPGEAPVGQQPLMLRPLAGGISPKGPLRPAAEAAIYGGPAGGGYSTAHDMQQFFAALDGGKLVSQVMLKAMRSDQIVVVPATSANPARSYGLGFGLGVFEGHSWYGHNGGAPGVNTEMAAFPDDHASIVVLSDRDPPAATMLFQRTIQLAFAPKLCDSRSGVRSSP